MMTSLFDGKRTFFTGLVLVGLISLVGCTAPKSDVCSTGIVCQIGTTCSSDGHTCVKEGCGSSEIDTGELCDDGNNESGDGCSADCLSEERCGDGYTDESIDEACDDGNTEGGDGCNADCSILEQCGDGILSEGEACDDGNEDDLDDCNKSCSSDNSCGNGIIDFNVGERCDPGLTPDECNADCTSNLACGNGVVDPGEECDDGDPDEDTPGGNGDNSDDCITTDQFACQAAECGDGFVRENPENPDDAEECDDGEETEDCNSNCTLSECGDGVINASSGEICDDGDLNGEQGRCGTDCQSELVCGDGIRTLPELCDGPRDTDPAECNETCDGFAPYCGDGNQDDGEECDFGESNSNDEYNGCTRACTLGPYCGNRIPEGLEQCDALGGNVAVPAWTDNFANAQCSLACALGPYCGDETLQPEYEDCDGNQSIQGPLTSGVICYEGCQGYCGDGKDDGASNDPADKDASNFEGCDDGPLTYDSNGDPSGGNGYNPTNGGCRTNCTRCGDGVAQTGAPAREDCDEGDPDGANGNRPVGQYNASRRCNIECAYNPYCGDGGEHPNKVCDFNRDANCEESCLWGVGAGCTGDDQCDSNTCSIPRNATVGTCIADPVCGDISTNGGEQCDNGSADTPGCNGNSSQAVAVNAECRVPACGDRYVNNAANEACDRGYSDTDTCNGNGAGDNSCHFSVCGDGHTNYAASEQCDRGHTDTNSCIGSSAPEALRCQNSRCGDGYTNSAADEVCDSRDRTRCSNDCDLVLGQEGCGTRNDYCEEGTCQSNRCVKNPGESCPTGTPNVCGLGSTCSNGTCRYRLGQTGCSGNNNWCTTNRCEENACKLIFNQSGCSTNAHCADGNHCSSDGVCKKPNGLACGGDGECASGFCDDEGDDATDQCQTP